MCSLYSLTLIYLCLCSSLGLTIADVRRRQLRQSPDVVTRIDSTSSKEGFITSPNFPSTSESKEENRVYKFQGRPDERVQITFNDFDLYKLSPNERCGWRNSFVSFERDLDEPVFLCGPHPLPLLSEKSEFLLKYEVPRNFREEEKFRGFNASYKFITNFGVNTGKQIQSDQCHFEYDSKNAQSGSFNSPNFPGLYPRNTDCTFTFHGTEKFLKIDFTQFNLLGSNKTCSSDLVDVLELTETTKNYESFFEQRRCGHQEPFSIKVEASSFTVTLVRSTKKLNDSVFNEPKSFVGFEANYKFTDEKQNGESSGFSNLLSGSSLHLFLTALYLVTSSCHGLLRFI